MSRYIRFVIENVAPVRIANDETSQHGQTDTLKYIPGSTLRGLVVNSLLSQGEKFEKYKKQIFSSKVQFMNAYLMVEKKELIPSLKGFYEDKKEYPGKKPIENVMTGDIAPGTKRASLGHYCYINEDCVFYTDVQTGEDLNINTGRDSDKAIFRSQYIKKGQRFAGYINFTEDIEEELILLIAQVFHGIIYMGNKRSAGYGACICISTEIKEGMPYEKLRNKQISDTFFLVLLSDMVMVNEYGEMAGLYIPELEKELGCEKLTVIRCATSIREVYGYNRIWKGAVPSAVMYEAGSVFYIKAVGMLQKEKLRSLEKKGIGIRRNEGFGQIAVWDSYGEIRYKKAFYDENTDSSKYEETVAEQSLQRAEIQSDLEIAAKGLLQYRIERAIEKYIVEDASTGNLKGISKSKRGVVESMCMQLRYTPQEAREQLERYIKHLEVKDSRLKDQTPKRQLLHLYVKEVLQKDLCEILNLEWKENKIFGIRVKDILSGDDEIKYKLKLIINQIRYVNRKEKDHAE